MLIRPNPNNGNFTIELTYVTNKTTIEIFDHIGKLIFGSKIISLETELNSGLPKGNYVAKILENNAVISIQNLFIGE
ncbi:MAG TPA: T9SS type A sorting domain-containing protein [Bacteroidia bacterium]|jgi:hypothetical protein|nr:T9SS type A sorting domain-containing protein [Bacteroidia bacterium]